jgi:hypothetical protein
MMVRNWRAAGIGSLLTALAVVLAITGATQLERERAQAQSDPQAVVEGLIDAFNAGLPVGDGASVAAHYTEDGHIIFIEGGSSFGIFGRTALTGAFSEPDPSFNLTVIEISASGNTVNAKLEIRESAVTEAGFDRTIADIVAVVEGDAVASLVLTPDLSDPETAQYDAFLASQPGEGEGELPPDVMQLELTGSQPGLLFTGTFEIFRFIGIDIAPGPAGVVQPVAIHEGTCETPGAAVQSLAPVVNGSSESITSLTLPDLENRIVVVRASETDPTVVACGAFADLAAVPLSPPAEPVAGPDTGDGPNNRNALATLLLVVAGALAFGGVTLLALGVRRRA